MFNVEYLVVRQGRNLNTPDHSIRFNFWYITMERKNHITYGCLCDCPIDVLCFCHMLYTLSHLQRRVLSTVCPARRTDRTSVTCVNVATDLHVTRPVQHQQVRQRHNNYDNH